MALTFPVDVAPQPVRRNDTAAALDPPFWIAAVGALLAAFGLEGPASAAIIAVAVVLHPGILVVSTLQPVDRLERTVVVLGTSIVSWMVVAHVALSVRWWSPGTAVASVLGLCAVARLIQINSDGYRSPRVHRSLTPVVRRQLALSATVLGLWWLSTTRLDVSDIGLTGLAADLPLLWYVAFGLAVAGAAHAATSPRTSPERVVVALAPVLVMIYGTIAVSTGTVRYPWAYKHIGVVRLLDETGRLHPDVDIYNNFSGFFGLIALVRGSTGVDPTSYAAWAQLVGEALVVLGVGYLVHRVTDSVRVAYLASVLYVLTNWVGQNYFAAQTLASFLSLATLGLIWSWFRRGSRVDGAGADEQGNLATRRRVAVAALYLGLLMTHPLTPIVVIAAVGIAFATRHIRDRVLIGLLIAVSVLWFVRVIPYFAAQDFDLGFGGAPTDNASGNVDATESPAGSAFVSSVTRWFSVGVWLAAVVGGLVSGFARRRIGLLVVLAMIPFGIPLVQSYGGEAIYRVYLYSLPLMVALIAWGIVSSTPVRRRDRLPQPTVLAATVCLAVAAGFVIVHYGRERINQVDSSEVAIDQLISDTVEGPAIVAQFSGSYPAQSTSRYPEFQVNDTYTPHVVEMLGPTSVLPAADELDDVADDLVELTAGTPYVVVSPGMIDEISSVGSFPVADTTAATEFLLSNRRFTLAARIGDTYLVEVAR